MPKRKIGPVSLYPEVHGSGDPLLLIAGLGADSSCWAEEAIKLLDALGIERAHLIGHSMGGYIAQEIAINYPGRVNKIVLEGTAPVPSLAWGKRQFAGKEKLPREDSNL